MNHSIHIRTVLTALMLSSAAMAMPVVAQTAEPEAISSNVDSATRGPINAQDRIAGLGYKKLSSDAQLSSDDGTIVAHLSLDYAFASAPTTREVDGASTVTSSFTNVSAKLAVPLNSAEAGSKVDFRSFGNQAKLTINFNHIGATFAEPGQDYGYVYDFGATCLRKAGDDWKIRDAAILDPNEAEAQITAFINAFRANQKAPMSLGGAMDKAAALDAVGPFGAIATKACRPGPAHTIKNENQLGDRFALATLGQDEYRAWFNRNRGNERVFYFGGEASLGYNRFSVVNSSTYRADKFDRIGFDGSLRIGLIFPSLDTQVSIGAGYTRRFVPGDEVEICSPPNGIGATTCAKGLPSIPTPSETAYAELRVRKVLLRRDDDTPLLAIAPSIAYVEKDKNFELRVPLYFQRNEKGGLDAGVQAVWNNASSRFAIGAFVGVPF